jgi:hypothetical protein
MDDLHHKQEVEKLARTLRQSKVASSESDAFRMASEMLATQRKVHEDHKMREAKIYGEHLPNAEQKKATMIMEKLSENLSKGKSNVRIDVEELNLNTPLKEMVKEEESPVEEEEDDAVLVNDESLKESAEATEELKMPAIIEAAKPHDEEDDFYDDDDDDSAEEEKDEGSIPSASEDSSKDEDEGFTIREL